MKRTVKKAIFFACAALCVAVLIAVTTVVGVLDQSFADIFGGNELDSATRAAGEALSLQIEEEGSVLVKNDNNTLPLKADDVDVNGEHRVNVFGWAAIDWLMGGSGSGRAVNSNDGNSLKPQTDLLKALNGYDVLSQNGIKYNTELTDFYKNFKSGRDGKALDTLHAHDYESCVLYEPQITAYSDTIKANAVAYSDVALVVLGRISGESNDAPKVQYKVNTKGGSRQTDNSRTYLDISTEERDLLTYVGENFGKVIVIINSTNTMNLSFMDDIKGLDSCLIVGGTGNNGANAIPNILFGKKRVKVQATNDDGTLKFDDKNNPVYEKDANGNDKTEIVDISPSGKTVDTYAYDFKSNPNFVYSGIDGVSYYTGTSKSLYPLTTTNPNVGTNDPYTGVSYLDYAEGIYVGYKWYETADVEHYFDTATRGEKKGYDAVVQYPFGHGLTYTTFEHAVTDWTVDDTTASVTVKITYTGSVPAQEVVQLYYTPFYDKTHGIEKSAVNLAAFAKTPTAVKPGVPQTLTLKFDIRDMASYVESEGDGAYVLEEGDYILSLRSDSHNALTVTSGTNTYTYNPGKKVVYDTYGGTNGINEIKNLFTGENVTDGIAVDGSDTEAGIENVWLSRADFAGTFKTKKVAARAWNSKLLKNNLYKSEHANAWDKEWLAAYQEEYGETPVFKQGQEREYRLTEENGDTVMFTDDMYFFGNPENYDDDAWETLLNQLTESEMRNLILHGYIHEEALNSIGKPRTQSLDGPSQIGSFNVQTGVGIGYPMPTVLAQSFNAELARNYGLAVGDETVKSGRSGWYAPGVNLHRSAFGGRNYEYYSEDSMLSGIMCAAVVRGALDSGVYTYIKHFIGYDQESYRDGLYCWMTEQALRETYLSPYKRAIDSGASGIMTSYGRIGSVWSGGSRSLLTDLLRDEWGFKGTVITDYSDHQEFMNGDQMIRAGGDLWMDGYGDTGSFKMSTSSAAFKYHARLASKHIIYMWANAAFENRAYLSAGSDEPINIGRTFSVFRWWWLVVAAVDVLCAAGAAVLIIFALKKPKTEKAAAENNGAETGETPDTETSETPVTDNAETPADTGETPDNE